VPTLKRVVIVSHADADGHVIAEQVRRNLAKIATFDVSTVVDPARTRDHKTWLKLNAIPEIEPCDLVFFVDLMFAPPSFVAEADALVDFALKRPTKRFFVLDHHPLPLGRLCGAPNLRPVYRPDVFDCTFGRASRLMELAALLESQPTRVRARNPEQVVLVKGIRRAAAAGGPLSGAKLLALMRFERWDELAALGRDDPNFHRLVRGLRPASYPISELMIQLDKLATDLLEFSPIAGESYAGRGAGMTYDLDLDSDWTPPMVAIPTSNPRDLEAISTLVELAAIVLTHGPESSFTEDELFAQACDLGGAK
jgi:hypothetical protein